MKGGFIPFQLPRPVSRHESDVFAHDEDESIEEFDQVFDFANRFRVEEFRQSLLIDEDERT